MLQWTLTWKYEGMFPMVNKQANTTHNPHCASCCISQSEIFLISAQLPIVASLSRPLPCGIQIQPKQCITNLEANHAKNIFLDVLPKSCKKSATPTGLCETLGDLTQLTLLTAVCNYPLLAPNTSELKHKENSWFRHGVSPGNYLSTWD